MKHEKKEHHKKEHEKKMMKKGGHVEGKKGHHKEHHFAEGGKVKSSAMMTPASPLSGAGKMGMRMKGSENN